MKNIYKYLKDAEKEKTYQDVFGAYNLKLKNKICEEDLNSISNATTPFEQNKLSKLSACKKYNKDISLKEAYWIINDWGGIGSFKEKPANNTKISQFLNKIKIGNSLLTRDEFSTISSLSKISFFYDANKYCIYDSRVIYSLNWIIYKTKENIKFFPMPSGRNKKIASFPIEAIINFSLLGKGETDFSKFYYPKKEVYKIYNELMTNLSLELFGDQAKPFFAEMLLFGLADNYVYQDMKREIEIKIKNWT